MPKESNEGALFGSQGFITIPAVEKFSTREKMAHLKSHGYLITEGSGISAEAKQPPYALKWLKHWFITEVFTPIPISCIHLDTNLRDQTEEAVGDITLQYADIIPADDWRDTSWGVLRRLSDSDPKKEFCVGLAPIFALMERQSSTGNGAFIRGNNLFFVQNPDCGVLYAVRVVLREQFSLYSGTMGFLDPTTIRRAFFPPFSENTNNLSHQGA